MWLSDQPHSRERRAWWRIESLRPDAASTVPGAPGAAMSDPSRIEREERFKERAERGRQ
jgi:hypothetical protein